MNKKPKCIWMGTIDSRVISVKLKTLNRISTPTEKTFYVLPEFEPELRDFNDKFVNHGRLFLILIIGLTLLLSILSLMALIFNLPNSITIISVGIITSLMGLVIVKLPFATPETVKWLGIKRSIVLARNTGLITILLGIVICFLTLL